MKYQVYHLKFITNVHFGVNNLESSEFTFCADTLFSALCNEAIRMGQQELLDRFVNYVVKGNVRFSDGLPFSNKNEQYTYYIPKPMMKIVGKREQDNSDKKKFKKLKFLPFEQLDTFLTGNMTGEKAEDITVSFGKFLLQTRASVRDGKDTVPYNVGCFKFKDNCGLYVIMQYETEEEKKCIDRLITSLSYTGIGGKRSSGFGKYQVEIVEHIPEIIKKRLTERNEKVVSLSISLPRKDEMEKVLDNASYLLVQRSGFVASESYQTTWMKKKNLYCFQAGSCFEKEYEGDVYDVSSEGGKHPVYRYAKPLWIGV